MSNPFYNAPISINMPVPARLMPPRIFRDRWLETKSYCGPPPMAQRAYIPDDSKFILIAARNAVPLMGV